MEIIMNKFIVLLVLILTININAEEKEWNVNNPPGRSNDVEFTVSEGTWMNLDVSPDGKTIAFDLLGDIYTIPKSGGKATPIRTGLAWEVQPRFSPDGKYISFTSDAGGADNIWIMDTDGSDAKQITKEDFRLLNNAVWSHDSEFLIARKHFTSTRSAGAGEMWMYHISGGSGIQLTEKKNDQQDVNEPSVSKDCKYLYYSEDMYPGGFFQYNKDPNKGIYVIKRYSFDEGKSETYISGSGSAFRPQISPDGKYLAFVSRVRTKTILFIKDTETGEEWPIFDKLIKDQQEAWAIFGVYPGFAWSPDGKSIVIYGNGKLWEVDVNTKDYTEIPFEVNARHKIQKTVRFDNKVHEDEIILKVLRGAVTSPDGNKIVYNAAGYLYIYDKNSKNAKRLTNDKNIEYEPSFSSDGTKLVYVTWSDSEKGKIMIYDFNSKSSKKVNLPKGIYRTPSLTKDKSTLLYLKESGNEHQGFDYTTNPGIYTLDLENSNSKPKLISESGEYPLFNNKDSRIYFQTGGYYFGSLDKGFHSVDLTGNDKKQHFSSKYSNKFVPSPDGNFIAFNELHKVYIARFPKSGQSIDLSANTKSIPVAEVASDAGINLHWSNDSKKLHWTLGADYHTISLEDSFDYINKNSENNESVKSDKIEIQTMVKSDKPDGLLAFTNARILTMDEDSTVIENGTVVIDENKILNFGFQDEVAIPKNVKVYDLKGKTIMPGLIDVHAHQGTFRYGLSPEKHWPYYANLAYGVTTTHDPSSNSEMVFSHSEMIKTGRMVGPRTYSTGIILYGADGDFKAVVNNLEDAKSHLRRTKAFGAFSVKSYNQPRRNQRQQIIEAARELEMLVFPEGGSHFFHNLSMVADGHTGIEHNIPVAPLYDDVLKFWSNTETHNTPTLVVNYGSVTGEYYWYQNTNVWEKERLLNFTPREVIDSRARHRTMIPNEEYDNGHILTSQSLKKMTDNGIKVNMGAHGQLQGLGAHWEMWMLHQGGMSNMEVLQAATINGATYLGMDSEIGSIETGKLADLIVIDGNPLDDIYTTENVVYTIINGRMYESETMDEIGNYNNPKEEFWWDSDKYDGFDFHQRLNSFELPKCQCGYGTHIH
jgi:imidazolonepropionase-like amidohydrolase/Tol biopolymer transport system component